jgi:hypothetical protein
VKLLEYASGDGYAALEFDAAEEETYEHSASTTEHAVERGAPVTDHARRMGDTISLRVWVSNRPLFLPRGGTDGVTLDRSAREMRIGGQTFRATTLAPSGPYDRTLFAHALLEALVGNGLCRYSGSLDTTVEDLILTRYVVTRKADTGGALAATLELKRMRFATTERQDVAPRQRRAIPQDERGQQPAQPVSTLRAGRREAADAVRAAAREMFGGGE